MIEGISAVTLGTPRDAAGCPILPRASGLQVPCGNEQSSFTSFSSGDELSQSPSPSLPSGAGSGGARVIPYVADKLRRF